MMTTKWVMMAPGHQWIKQFAMWAFLLRLHFPKRNTWTHGRVTQQTAESPDDTLDYTETKVCDKWKLLHKQTCHLGFDWYCLQWIFLLVLVTIVLPANTKLSSINQRWPNWNFPSWKVRNFRNLNLNLNLNPISLQFSTYTKILSYSFEMKFVTVPCRFLFKSLESHRSQVMCVPTQLDNGQPISLIWFM